MNLSHTLRGTVYVKDATEAEQKAHEAACDYFGDTPVLVNISVREQRTIGGQVIAYEVDYEAAPDPDRVRKQG